jgi:hypothetical protein
VRAAGDARHRSGCRDVSVVTSCARVRACAQSGVPLRSSRRRHAQRVWLRMHHPPMPQHCAAVLAACDAAWPTLPPSHRSADEVSSNSRELSECRRLCCSPRACAALPGPAHSARIVRMQPRTGASRAPPSCLPLCLSHTHTHTHMTWQQWATRRATSTTCTRRSSTSSRSTTTSTTMMTTTRRCVERRVRWGRCMARCVQGTQHTAACTSLPTALPRRPPLHTPHAATHNCVQQHHHSHKKCYYKCYKKVRIVRVVRAGGLIALASIRVARRTARHAHTHPPPPSPPHNHAVRRR